MNSSTQTNPQDAAVENHSRSRLFTFGCSFTKYHWATWADILGQEFTEHQNWGQTGGGNLFIVCSLIEAIQRGSINEKDTVVIMWSSPGREDRWVNGEWITPGSIYNQNVYPKDWVDKFADPTGYLIRDAALISSAIKVLDNIKCKYYMLSMMPFEIINDADISIIQKIKSKFNLVSGAEQNNISSLSSDQADIFELYQSSIDKIRSSMFETVFNNDWYSRTGFKTKTWIETSYKESKESWAPHWPEYENFIDKQVTEEILQEIKQCYDFEDIELFIKEIHRFQNRNDIHPTPLEHLEYLQKILPEIPVTETTVKWTQARQLDAEKGILFNHPDLVRF